MYHFINGYEQSIIYHLCTEYEKVMLLMLEHVLLDL